MTDLTPEKIKELTALMATAPPETAARLLVMFERMKLKGSQIIPSNALIAAMRDAGMTHVAGQAKGGVRMPSFERLFFAPFESLFENGDMADMLPGALPRTALKRVWKLVRHVASDELSKAELIGNEAILRGDMDKARSLTKAFRQTLIEELSEYPIDEILECATTPEEHILLSRFLPLLRAEAIGHDIWSGALSARGDLSDHAVTRLCHEVRILEDSHPEVALELLLMTMTTLPRPAEALRILAKVSLGVDDRKLDMTPYAVIGRRVIGCAGRYATLIEKATNHGAFDGIELAANVDRYNNNLKGLEREANLSADGPWRKAIGEIRSRVGNRLDILCQNATFALEAALPVNRLQVHNVTWTHEPKLHAALDKAKVEAAVRHLHFVTGARLFAPTAGFGAARDKAAKHADAYVNRISEELLKFARSSSRPPNFESWVDATASVIEALEGVKAAHLFERRIAATAIAA